MPRQTVKTHVECFWAQRLHLIWFYRVRNNWKYVFSNIGRYMHMVSIRLFVFVGNHSIAECILRNLCSFSSSSTFRACCMHCRVILNNDVSNIFSSQTQIIFCWSRRYASLRHMMIWKYQEYNIISRLYVKPGITLLSKRVMLSDVLRSFIWNCVFVKSNLR